MKNLAMDGAMKAPPMLVTDQAPEPTSAGTGFAGRLKALTRSRILRIAVSVLLLAFLLSRMDLAQLADTLRGIDPGLLAVGVLIFLICNMVSVFKWRVIVRTQGTPVSYFYLTSLFYIGLFFNNFLPSNIGGDVVRTWKLSKVTGKPVEAVSSVVLDRASSTFALLLIAIVPALFELRLLGARVAALIIAMFVVSVVAIVLLANERAVLWLGRFRLFRSDAFGIRGHIKNFYYSLYKFGDHKGALGIVFGCSLAYQALHITTIYFLAMSLGIHLPVVYFFLFIPIVIVVGLIPISLNGLGMREGAWVLLFGQVGLSSAEAFSMSILSYIVVAVVSLAGGIFYLFDRAAPAPQGDASHG